MSIPRKGSRSTRVGENDFAWVIRKKPTYAQAIGGSTMHVAIQSRDPSARSVLLVDLRITRSDSWMSNHQTGITPAAIRDMIERALHAGWDPHGRVSPFRLDYPVPRETIGYVHREKRSPTRRSR